MIKRIFPLAAAVAAGFLAGGLHAQDASFKDPSERTSYAIGLNIGAGLKQQTDAQGLNLKPDLVAAGVKDALLGGKARLGEEEVRDVLASLEKDMRSKQVEVGEKNKKEGEAFLAENKKKAGVKALPDGLQYLVVKEGKGPKPKATDTVKVNYKGTFLDGTEFDSSEKRGPVTFPLNRVIKAWTEALQLMPVGSKWRLFVPSELAYGPQGAGSVIPPNATLIFDVELLGIEPAGKS